MKKSTLLIILCATTVLFSCKKKEEKAKDTQETAAAEFVVKPEATTLTWTAYKTTDKTPVKGTFTVLDFENKAGASVQEALNGLQFSIPISSLFTDDATGTRDPKIKTSFFGAMLNTIAIKGKLKAEGSSYSATISMNGVTHTLPLEVSITDERRVTLKGVMQLKDWNALGALESLNAVCFDLHKGADGVSKTWEDVAIEVSTYLRKG